jgi:hypothetical protein
VPEEIVNANRSRVGERERDGGEGDGEVHELVT